ncbi:hypothetical protein J8TS2_35640 [Lederbergia ruris]|uniref:Uncharacterized protein n=1 Tax=Lederbergia ruris TaxID=217495 RepID=A0ABQ4KMU1_9BACI|nr:hypothetical protein [Lederbergia ruris]GIN59245.1 hypothetical protein J8TS2_35640 [Lederbergia ruris]
MSESVLSMYDSLMQIGLTQNEIDEMDLIYHLKLLAHKKNSSNDNKNKQPLTIDQIIG